jgi:GT2 family glycosyltransferase
MRHPVNIGPVANIAACMNFAKGKYIKYLMDDDLLEPDCIRVMAQYLDEHPEVALVTSKRTPIDQAGNTLPDFPPTRRATDFDALLTGSELIEAVLILRLNIIGEPSTVMFRKSLVQEPCGIFSGISFRINVDIALWFQLLTQGDAIYLINPQSRFRLHPGQGHLHNEIIGSLEWVQLVQEMRKRGYLQDQSAYRNVLNINTFHLQRLLSGLPSELESWRTPLSEQIHWIEEEIYRLETRLQPKKINISTEPDSLPADSESLQSVSIIIPTFNNLDLTEKCLESIFNTLPTSGIETEIIVVDNASTDGTKELLAGLSDKVTIISNPTNMGFSKALNQGAELAGGEFLLFLNNDTLVTGDWLTNMLQPLLEDKSVGIVGCKLLFPDETIQHAGVGFTDIPGWLEGVHVYRGYPRHAAEVNYPREMQAVTFACCAVNRKLYFEIGRLDEEYINGLEDIDFCLKVKSAGLKAWYEPKAEIFHLESQTQGRSDHVMHNIARFRHKWEHTGIIQIDTEKLEGVYHWKQESNPSKDVQ